MKLVRASIAAVALLTAAAVGAVQTPPPQPPGQGGGGPPPRMGQDMQREYDLFELRKKGEGFDASKYQLDKTELKLLRDIEKKAKANKMAEAVAAARVAAGSVHSIDGKFVLGALELQLAEKTGDGALRYLATSRVIDSGKTPPAILPMLLKNRGVMALDRNDLATADASFSRLVMMVPTNADHAVALAQIKMDLGKVAEASAMFDKAISLKTAAGQPVPEIWTKAANYARKKAAATRQ